MALIGLQYKYLHYCNNPFVHFPLQQAIQKRPSKRRKIGLFNFVFFCFFWPRVAKFTCLKIKKIQSLSWRLKLLFVSVWFSDRSDIVPRILSRQQRSSIIWRDKRGLTLRINEHKYQFSYTFLLTAVHKPPTGQKKKAWNLDLEELAVIWQKCCKIKWRHHLQKNLLPLIMRYQLRMELLSGLCLDSGFTLYFSCSGKKDFF